MTLLIARCLNLAAALVSGCLFLLYTSVVPISPWYEPCGLQFFFVLPAWVLLLLISVPAVIAGDCARLRVLEKWYAPAAAFLCPTPGLFIDSISYPLLAVGAVLSGAVSVWGIFKFGVMLFNEEDASA